VFSDRIEQVCPVTVLCEDFKDRINQDGIRAGTKTCLFDAVTSACAKLAAFRRGHCPEGAGALVLRVLALTDGEDEGSSASAAEALKALRREGVILDSIVLGARSRRSFDLDALAAESGGAPFRPPSWEDAIALFDSEGMIRFGARAAATATTTATTTTTTTGKPQPQQPPQQPRWSAAEWGAWLARPGAAKECVHSRACLLYNFFRGGAGGAGAGSAAPPPPSLQLPCIEPPGAARSSNDLGRASLVFEKHQEEAETQQEQADCRQARVASAGASPLVPSAVLRRDGPGAGAAAVLACARRVIHELVLCHKEAHPDIEAFASEADVRRWTVLVRGPEDSLYAGCHFALACEFPTGYPIEPPAVRFCSKIKHLNINSDGRICHDIFGSVYTASVHVKEIFRAVHELLAYPQADSAMDSLLCELYLRDQPAYEREVQAATRDRAATTREEVLQQHGMVDDVDAAGAEGVPDELVCPLTGCLFREPVTTVELQQSGLTYERGAVLPASRPNH
jgi:ubiquitin-protein ligase